VKLSALCYQAELIADSNAHDPKLVGVILKHGHPTRIIPVGGAETGGVLGGDNDRLAAARQVWQPKAGGAPGATEVLARDEGLASQAINTQNWKAPNEFSGRVIVGSLDKLNPWKWETQAESQTAVLLQDAIKAISQQALAALSKVLGGKSFDELTTTEMLPCFQSIDDPDRAWGSPVSGEKPYVNGTRVFREAQQETFNPLQRVSAP